MARYEPLKQSSEDLDLDLLPMRTRRDPGGTGRAATTVRIARNYGGWLVAVLLLLHSIRTSSSSSRREKGCWDPYTSLGYIYRPSNGSIRWIPYPPTLSSPRNTLSFPTAIDDSLDPPPEALALAPPAYGEMLNRIGTDEGMKDMEWARGRRIVFVGDSHDRSNVEGFCNYHSSVGARISVPHFHIKAHCRIPTLDLTLASWFHYGLAPESDSLPSDPSNASSIGWNIPSLPTSRPNENPAPFAVEGRMEEYWLPDTATSVENGGLGGKPDLIVLNSFFWDLRYFALHAREHTSRPSSLRAEERPLTYSELVWHRYRIRQYVELVQRAFPDVPVMFRLGQQHATSRNEGNVAVFQLNESLRAVLGELDIPIFEWARIISGESHYNDDQHLTPGAPARLFGDMALFYLRRAVEGWDRCKRPS